MKAINTRLIWSGTN